MRKLMEQVREFHEVAGLPLPNSPGLGQTSARDRRLVAEAAELVQNEAALLCAAGEGSLALCARLMLEELAETLEAAARGDLIEVADGLADLAYVTAGTAVEWGIPLAACSDAVHASNMAKFPVCEICKGSPEPEHDNCAPCRGTGRVVLLDDSGKVAKPEGWAPPDLRSIIQEER